jgi:asparagine synthase (glutamine-hydrolysing)
MHTAISQSQELERYTNKLRGLLVETVQSSPANSILLSGGLDTSIVASIASKWNPDLAAFTVILNDAPAPDLEYSRMVSARLGLRHHQIVKITLDVIEGALQKVIEVLGSFDPMEIRNSVAIYLGLTAASMAGHSRVLTGDGADELFAGYSFVVGLSREEAEVKLRHLWEVMHFSSIPLGRSLGIQSLLPFLDQKVKAFAMDLPFDFLVGKDKFGGLHGKFILRKAFEDALPFEIVWRKKTPIEYGCGTTILPQIYAKTISDSEFVEKKTNIFEKDHVRIRDKEQLHYYEIYRREFGPPTPDPGKRMCPGCTSILPPSANFCTTCGEYPV